jgi:hypothetical protein
MRIILFLQQTAHVASLIMGFHVDVIIMVSPFTIFGRHKQHFPQHGFYSRMSLGRADSAGVSRRSRNPPLCTMSFLLRRAFPLSTRRRRTVLCLRNRSTPLLEILQFPCRTWANSAMPSSRSLFDFSTLAFRSRCDADLSVCKM